MGSKAFKPTLENCTKILAIVGNPHERLTFVHVAGSNGKGSTSCMLSSILTESGYKTGLFTSPHIKDYRERIRINGQVIEENEVVEFIKKIRSSKLDFSPSFFEITFALSVHYFEQKKCDICVIETGLGGRLDATNVITPLLSIITNISLEHTDMLGDTIEKIATEKAGIIKQKTGVVLGKMLKTAENVMRNHAFEKSTQVHEDEMAFTGTFPLLGEFQRENFQTVLKSVDFLSKNGFRINEKSIEKGLKNLHQNSGLIGRLQIIQQQPLIILDVAHNADGVEKSLETVKRLNKGKLHILYGTSKDKNYSSIIELFPAASTIYLTTFPGERSLKKESLEEIKNTSEKKIEKIFTNSKQAFSDVNNRLSDNDTLIVLGSFFLIAEII